MGGKQRGVFDEPISQTKAFLGCLGGAPFADDLHAIVLVQPGLIDKHFIIPATHRGGRWGR